MDKSDSRSLTFCFVLLLAVAISPGKEYSRSFELRYYTGDSTANGETDFKGDTAVFDTEQRVEFLRKYAEYSKGFFNDPKLTKEVVTDKEVAGFLNKLKPQPLPILRSRLELTDWKWIGFRPGQRKEKQQQIDQWNHIDGVRVENEVLIFTEKAAFFQRSLPTQDWRFFIQWKVKVGRLDKRAVFSVSDPENGMSAAIVGFNDKGRLFYSSVGKQYEFGEYQADNWYEFKIEVDMSNGRYNLYVNGRS